MSLRPFVSPRAALDAILALHDANLEKWVAHDDCESWMSHK